MSRFTGDHSTSHVGSLKALFRELRDKPDPTFLETIVPIAHANAIPEALEAAEVILMQAEDRTQTGGDLTDDTIPVNNLCSILQYCAEDTDPPLYRELNNRCYNKDRNLIKPFLSFIWLLMKTLQLLPPYQGSVVNRGVRKDLKDNYPVGKQFVWHGFTSTTKDVGVLHNPMFLGTSGKRTIFQIELTQKQARDISKYSPLPEGEVLLPPACRFKVKGCLSPAEGLTVIQLVEMKSPAWIMDLRPDVSLTHKEITDIFVKFDLDGNGSISVEELGAALVDLGMEESIAERILSVADTDGNGAIDYCEFVNWICSGDEIARDLPQCFSDKRGTVQRADPNEARETNENNGAHVKAKDAVDLTDEQETNIISALSVIDSDRDGFLSLSELKIVLGSMGFALGDDALMEFMAKMDFDGDGRINYQDYRAWLETQLKPCS
eukprot:TRINITY_DN26858_c0_g1_i1.p1 TRINITY_DN26858_c0_g1~~TRINITY_DN26858_c0_g1_i1.p1  ORF type:complete len:436 (+),score=71.81 TRINITY_DN26858_c0_g1_i1:83-1390(+)